MTNTPVPYEGDGDLIHVTPLKTGVRSDWYVQAHPETSGVPVPFTESDIVAQMRRFFDLLDAEAALMKNDPIAMANALARLEALLADVRVVTNTVRKYTADALDANKIRRFTIEGLVTVEGTSEQIRTDWQNVQLLHDMLSEAFPMTLLDTHTGEVVDLTGLAELILSWVRVQWRLTPIRTAGLDPDNYSTVSDERTPAVRMVTNVLRQVA